jgi:hypothetical protein
MGQKAGKIAERIAEINEDLLVMDGFDEAIVGIGSLAGNQHVVYDIERIISIIMRDMQLSRHDALDYFDFNIACAAAGEHTPIILECIQQDA